MRIRRSNKLLFTTILAFVFTLGTTEMTAQGDQVAKTNIDPIAGPIVSEQPARRAPAEPPGSPAGIGPASAMQRRWIAPL